MSKSIDAPRRSPYAFISDRPERFIGTHGLPRLAYIIEFTQRDSDFVRDFANFIRPRFQPNEVGLHSDILTKLKQQ